MTTLTDIKAQLDNLSKGSKKAYNELMQNFTYNIQSLDSFIPDIIHSLTDLSQIGNIHSRSFLSCLYLYGLGVKQDNEKALILARLSASMGDDKAEVLLGLMYLYGCGVVTDPIRAHHWFSLATKKHNARAPCHLGYISEQGLIKKTDLKEAFHYYQQSADNGDNYGLYNLGRCYELGIYIKPNYSEALRLYTLAAKKLPLAKNAQEALEKKLNK